MIGATRFQELRVRKRRVCYANRCSATSLVEGSGSASNDFDRSLRGYHLGQAVAGRTVGSGAYW